jgi:hypothetical protein
MSDLHVFSNTEIDVWVIAESPDEALMLYAEFLGYHQLAEYQNDTNDSVCDWKQLKDDALLRVVCEDEKEATAMTCSAWAREQGKGFLAGTDF